LGGGIINSKNRYSQPCCLQLQLEILGSSSFYTVERSTLSTNWYSSARNKYPCMYRDALRNTRTVSRGFLLDPLNVIPKIGLAALGRLCSVRGRS
jgi:hypothetical protein